jgi:hypothetical protein
VNDERMLAILLAAATAGASVTVKHKPGRMPRVDVLVSVEFTV